MVRRRLRARFRLASDDRAADRGLHTRHELPDRGHDRAILIAPGHSPQGILNRLDPEPLEQRCALRADSLRETDGLLPTMTAMGFHS